MHYSTLIFDLDGTLLDTLRDLMESVNYTLFQYSCPARTLDEIRSFIGNGVRILLIRSFPADFSQSIIEEALLIFRKHYAAHMYDHTCLYDGISSMLYELKQKGYQMGIVSNKLDSAVKKLHEIFFTDTISIAIGTGEEAKKPHPFYVFEAIKQLHSTIEDSIYIGDSDVDIETARNAGIPCIGVSWGFRGRSFLEEHRADYIVDTPKELISLMN